jgi:hypothetical protein
MPPETEAARELVETATTRVAFMLQPAKRRQAEHDVRLLSALGAGLTAGPAALILATPDNFLDVGAQAIPPTDLGSRPPQTMGGHIRGAVSDAHAVHPARHPAGRRPGGRAPRGPKRRPMAPAIVLEAADNIPAVVPKAFPQGLGGRPRLNEHVRRATAEAVAGVAPPR